MSSGYEFVGGGFGSFNPSDPRTDTTWRNAANHREQISKLLIGSTRVTQPTLCIWGAGPCTDLDLESLINHFDITTLVDLDDDTMKDGLRIRGLDSSEKIKTIGGLDLTGVSDLIANYKSGKTEDKEQRMGQILRTAIDYRTDRLERYDVVASTCLLSQLQNHITENVGEDDPSFVKLLQVTRRRHLELLLDHTKPGGSAILITDLTSSDALPELKQAGGMVSESIWKQIESGNFFHGMNPRAIGAEFVQNENIKSQLANTMMSRPWIWNATERLYACIAYGVLKK